MTGKELMDSLAALAGAGAALWAASVAHRGLNAWRDQQDAQVKRDAARSLLDAVEELRAAESDVRTKIGATPAVVWSPPVPPSAAALAQYQASLTSLMDKAATRLTDGQLKLGNAMLWAAFVLDAHLEGGPATRILAQADTLRRALRETSSRIEDGTLTAQPGGAWLQQIQPAQQRLLASAIKDDPFVREFEAHSHELREALRPFLLFQRRTI